MHPVFDPNSGYRAQGVWRQMLSDLIDSLSKRAGIQFTPTSWFIEDHPGHASASGCVDLRGPVCPAPVNDHSIRAQRVEESEFLSGGVHMACRWFHVPKAGPRYE